MDDATAGTVGRDSDAPNVSVPPVRARWFHAQAGAWIRFADEDDAQLEDWWQAHHDELPAPVEEPREAPEETKDAAKSPSRQRWIPERIMSTFRPARGERLSVLPPAAPVPNHTHVEHMADPDEPEETRRFKVHVFEDHLYDVDMVRMKLYPALWTGIEQSVVRATWFYVSYDGTCLPIAWDSALAADLDRAYDEARPWEVSLRLRAISAAARGRRDASDGPPTYHELPSVMGGAKITFEDAYTGRVSKRNIGTTIWSFMGDALIIRGYSRVAEAIDKARQSRGSRVMEWAARGGRDGSERPAAPEGETPASPQLPDDFDQDTPPTEDNFAPTSWSSLSEAFFSKAWRTKEQESATPSKETGSRPEERLAVLDEEVEAMDNMLQPSSTAKHIVFCIHGIGQKLSEDYSSLDFVHDVERLRVVCARQSQDAGMRKLLTSGRIKFIPVHWRRSLNFDPPDGSYSVTDIFEDATIPRVRAIISKVLLDIPMYFSHHHVSMVRSVTHELNRLYRVFIQRNPEFEQEGGRVSILGHSLGSALASDILTTQPTIVPPLHTRDAPGIHRTSEQLLFNTTHFFCVGSPFALMLYLNGARLIARRRPGNTPASDPSDNVTRDVVGRQGCLATEYIYNVYAATDPASSKLSATVDVTYSRLTRPVVLPGNSEDLQDALAQPRVNIGKVLADMMAKRNSRTRDSQGRSVQPKEPPNGGVKSGAASDVPSVKEPPAEGNAPAANKPPKDEPPNVERAHAEPTPPKTPTQESVPPTPDEHTKVALEELELGERRFRALNPHGCIDYVIESGRVYQFTQYIDMLRAHMSYWTSVPFANFLLRQLIPKPELERTDTNIAAS